MNLRKYYLNLCEQFLNWNGVSRAFDFLMDNLIHGHQVELSLLELWAGLYAALSSRLVVGLEQPILVGELVAFLILPYTLQDVVLVLHFEDWYVKGRDLFLRRDLVLFGISLTWYIISQALMRCFDFLWQLVFLLALLLLHQLCIVGLMQHVDLAVLHIVRTVIPNLWCHTAVVIAGCAWFDCALSHTVWVNLWGLWLDWTARLRRAGWFLASLINQAGHLLVIEQSQLVCE